MFAIKYRILVLKRPPEVPEHAKMHIQKIRHLAPEFYGQTHLNSINNLISKYITHIITSFVINSNIDRIGLRYPDDKLWRLRQNIRHLAQRFLCK